MNAKPLVPTTLESLSKAMRYQSLLLEAVIAELRLLRGMTDTELEFLKGGTADTALRLDEFQTLRREVFGA